MTTEPTANSIPTANSDLMTKMELMLQQMAMMDIDPADLAAYAEGQTTPSAFTVASFLSDRVAGALSKGQRVAWKSYIPVITSGLAGLCSCFCPECLKAFKGDSSWVPCPCVTAGACSCKPDHLGKGAAATGSCLEGCAALGDRPLASVRQADWDTLARWTQTRAQKRVAVRNFARGAAGRATHSHDGRSAVEHLRNLVGKLYELAVGDKIPGVRDNLAVKMTHEARPAPKARGYSEAQLNELWNALFTSGSNDVELDMAIVWFCLETGARRGGPLTIRIGDLLFHAGKVRLGEKNGKVDEQPASDRLLAFLLGHALRRGDIVVANAEGLALEEISVADVVTRRVVLRTDAPVLYYATPLKRTGPDGMLVSAPHPLTRKRFETLWTRLKRELPWLDEIHGRPHDLRKTSASFVERAFGHAVAQGWLRHAAANVTDIYTMAGSGDIEDAHRWLVGEG